MKIENISRYIQLYNVEKILFDEIGPESRKKAELEFDDFYKICMWKSPRPKKLYLMNKELVKKLTHESFFESDESKKMEILCKMKGINIRTASAILSVIYPDKYPVIDIRCLSILRDKYKLQFKKTINMQTWLKYLVIMRDIAQENNVTPREVDMAFFAMHKELLDNRNHQNLQIKKRSKLNLL